QVEETLVTQARIISFLSVMNCFRNAYELKVLSQFPSFKKEGCPKGGVVGEERKPYSYDS
ncbi:MAG: hypothetical protein KBA12_02385, partial [Bacteroides sp.]|nr:hypothetical protein [Bacteroides sp.]